MKVLLECGHAVEYREDLKVSMTGRLHWCHYCQCDKMIMEYW